MLDDLKGDPKDCRSLTDSIGKYNVFVFNQVRFTFFFLVCGAKMVRTSSRASLGSKTV